MISLTEEHLEKLHKVELEILLEFDRICRNNHIKYSITGGTLLGAVRHGGFIPWDDDADVSMLRTEYEKFVSVVDRDLNHDKFYFQDIDRTKGYRWGYGKLRRKNTIFLREHQEHMPYDQGIFMDIFPRDYVPDENGAEKVHKWKCFCVRKMLWSAVGRYAEHNPLMRLWYSILFYLSLPYVKNLYHVLVDDSKQKTGTVRALTFPVPHNERGYKSKWYDNYIDIEFEGHKLMVESSYKEWLKFEFHDYMKLPPIEKRKVHPVVDIKFPD